MKDIFDFINDEDVEKKLKELMYREIPIEVIIEENFINGRRLPGYGIYYSFFDYMINKGFSFDGNVIEVGTGYFPIFSRYIEQYQNERGLSGAISVYDPKLIETLPSRIEYNKEQFTEETDVSRCSLLVGVYPCSCTMTVVKSALKNDIPFGIIICRCNNYKEIDEIKKLTESMSGTCDVFGLGSDYVPVVTYNPYVKKRVRI